MSTEGWWIVQVMVRPVSTMLRTTRITTAAALASSPGAHRLVAIHRAASASTLLQQAASSKDTSQSHCVRGKMAACACSQLGSPEVGSSMRTMAGLEMSSTAMDRRLRCSMLRPVSAGEPTRRSCRGVSSTNSIICARREPCPS